MFDLIFSLFFFFFSVAIHLGICRRQKRAVLLIKTFFFISGFFLLIFWGASWLFHQSFPPAPKSLWTLPLPISATILYILSVFFYLSFYVNVKLVSPSQKIMTLIREKRCRTYQELLKYFTDSEFVQPRLDDLVDSGCAYLLSCAPRMPLDSALSKTLFLEKSVEQGRYRLSKNGRKIGRILEIYQKILGRPRGG